MTTRPEFGAGHVRLVDLDLDVAKTWDGDVVLLDQSEFEHNTVALAYPASVERQALRSGAELRRALGANAWPFDGVHLPYAATWFGSST